MVPVHPNHLEWSHVAAVSFSVIAGMFFLMMGLLAYIWRSNVASQHDIGAKLDKLSDSVNVHLVESARHISEDDCRNCKAVTNLCARLVDLDKRRSARWMRQEHIIDDLWNAYNYHTHQGIEGEGKVVRNK